MICNRLKCITFGQKLIPLPQRDDHMFALETVSFTVNYCVSKRLECSFELALMSIYCYPVLYAVFPSFLLGC